MTTFDDRKDAYENQYAHDQEAEFRILARRNKLLGLWAAEKLHLKPEEHEAYAKEVVAADFEEPGDEDVVRKVMGDFGNAGLGITDHELREQMHRLLQVAREQIRNG